MVILRGCPRKVWIYLQCFASSFDLTVVPQEDRDNKVVVHYLQSYSEDWGTARIDFSAGHRGSQIDSRAQVHESQVAEEVFDLAPGVTKPINVTITGLGGKVKLVELLVLSCNL